MTNPNTTQDVRGLVEQAIKDGLDAFYKYRGYGSAVEVGIRTALEAMQSEAGVDAIEEKAKQLYEQSRRYVEGRPHWDDLNPDDPYDMGMAERARATARADYATLETAPAAVTDEMVERFMDTMFGSYQEPNNTEAWVPPNRGQTAEKVRAALEAALTPNAVESGGAAHPDDLAVDRFAEAMKAKLAKKRAEGYAGWDDPSECHPRFLSRLLREHIEKGDPLDVGCISMMLHQTGRRISTVREINQWTEMQKDHNSGLGR